MSMISAIVAFTLAGTMPLGPLETGKEISVPMEFMITQGFSVSEAGLPGAVLQIDVPEGVELVGKVLSDRESARNQFLRAPYERLLKSGTNELKFKLTATPADDAAIHLNVLGYASKDDERMFVRQRYALPLKSGASLKKVDVSPSNWGDDTSLQLGDTVPNYEIPQADGTVIKLADYVGKSNIILTTYRAFW